VIRAEGEAEAATKISKAIAECGGALIEIRRIDVSQGIQCLLYVSLTAILSGCS
jgi:hypothetical protein